ncbi:MAG: zinc-ribbon domain-containing protein [Phycisphaerae bacterium]|nr:zinc-ribbon domain-containing protein [Phycisphaerae bacterium]
MSETRVRCPHCSVLLNVPREFKGTKVRCSSCETGFRIPCISDDDILDLLGGGNKDDTAAGAIPAEALAEELAKQATTETHEAAKQSPPVGCPAGKEGFALMRIGKRGPVFEFPASLLTDPKFRGSMPRHCLRCGANAHLRPHLIIFAHQLLDSSVAEPEFVEAMPAINEDDSRRQPIEELLPRLPKLKKLPEPANLPMPYWICDMCSPANMIFAQGEFSSQTGGICHLQIGRLWRAEDFLVNAGGMDSPAYKMLHKVLKKHPMRPWDNLPGVVQQRLRQWYQPRSAEKFVSYTPDRTHSRTEDGMAGIIVTNGRLIYNSSLRHRESNKGEPLELSFAMESGRMRLRIAGANWEMKNIIVDKPGLEKLRRSLTKEKFQAAWY